jgi:hypothetical protein
MQRFTVRQTGHLTKEKVHVVLKARGWFVSADNVFALTPPGIPGGNAGERWGRHNNVIPAAVRNDAGAVGRGSSSHRKATCQPR